MADVEKQMEANGLPTQFESTANRPEIDHSAANAAATISNSEITELKHKAPGIEVSSFSKPVPSTERAFVPDSQPAPVVNDVSMPTDAEMATDPAPESVHPATAETKINGHGPDFIAEPVTVPEPERTIDSTYTEPVIPSSIPSEIPSSSAVMETAESVAETAPISIPLPEQAPISDLRSAPHSDELPAQEVARIEAEKHELDNRADIEPQPMDALPSPPAPIPDQPFEKSNGLPSPPMQSPPPAPQPEHATLPVPEPVPETVPESEQAILPSSESAPLPSVEIQQDIPPVVSAPPTEIPPAPVPTPAEPVEEVSAPQDHEMTDAPSPVVKVAREREEEEDNLDTDEPAAKRIKTEEPKPVVEQTDFKIPDAPSTFAGDEDDAVTPSRLAHMKKVISNLKKSNASTSFRLPVDPVALNIPTYFDVVKKPMDLGTIDNKLKKNEYHSVRDFTSDFEQILQNCIIFNGAEHAVTQQGHKMQTSFRNQMQNLPSAGVVEPTKAEKKAAKPKIEPVRMPPRRSSVNAKAASPVASSPATFAPGPDGVPLIRRDSALDGRPKRAIVPPKRNSDFTGARPKKKKYELQLRFCDEVLKTIAAPKHWAMNQYFTHPVDPVALNIPTYFQIIKKPMDLSTVRSKLDGGMYEKAKDFEEDVRLVFRNCYKFNPEGDYVNQMGHQLEDLFSKEWEKKDDWIAAREPESEPTSVIEDDHDDDASEEEDEPESDEDRDSKIKALQAQIEAMSKQMGELTQKKKKKSTPPVATKKSGKPKKVKKETTSQFPNLGKSKSKDGKKESKKNKADKDRYVTFAEKQYISNGIAMLPERQMQEALKIIQSSVPSLANSDQNEIELDIEEVPNHALLKLLNFVKKYAGPPPDEPKIEPTESYSAPTISKSKKSKPMSKHEQEAQIAELKGKLENYTSGGSPDAGTTGAESSDDSSDSGEESEEE